MAGGRERDAAYQHLVGECTRFVTEAAPGHWRKIRRLAEAGYAETLLKEYNRADFFNTIGQERTRRQ